MRRRLLRPFLPFCSLSPLRSCFPNRGHLCPGIPREIPRQVSKYRFSIKSWRVGGLGNQCTFISHVARQRLAAKARWNIARACPNVRRWNGCRSPWGGNEFQIYFDRRYERGVDTKLLDSSVKLEINLSQSLKFNRKFEIEIWNSIDSMKFILFAGRLKEIRERVYSNRSYCSTLRLIYD